MNAIVLAISFYPFQAAVTTHSQFTIIRIRASRCHQEPIADFHLASNIQYFQNQLTSKSSQFKTIVPLWLELLDDVERIYRDELDQFPLSLIQSPNGGPLAECKAKQQALQIAQSILLTTVLCQLEPSLKNLPTMHWLVKSSQPTCGKIFDSVFNQNRISPDSYSKLSGELIAYFQRAQKSNPHHDLTELILSFSFSKAKKSTGVYYTPPDVARFLVEKVNQCLTSGTSFASGLARQVTRDGCNIFDPAVGAGIFLVELVNFFHRSREEKSSSENCWTESLVYDILPRLFGCDLLLPSLVAAHLNLAVALHKTGFDFESASRTIKRLNLVLANSLDDLEPKNVRELSEIARKEKEFTHQILRETSMHAIVGNPPFYSQSQNDGNWIRALIIGPSGHSRSNPAIHANYLEVDGERIRERKIWLHDDYVKFFRYAHWLIEKSGDGVIGFVSNRGFINNITFRGLRNSWLKSFDRIELIDLHGDSRNRDPMQNSESEPESQPKSKANHDENIFPIETGVAIAFLSRSEAVNCCCAVSYASINGSAASKIERLGNGIRESEFQRLEPAAPNYFFDPRDMKLCTEYESGWRISDAMPQYWSAPVTARDHFVIDSSQSQLLKRMEEFLDERVSDEKIREKYFSRTRSHRYQSGDSRGWKLADARRQLASREICGSIRRVHYRPFDHRWVFWSPEMIDWPRTGLAEQFLIPDNLVLVARRQSPPNVGANFFLVTSTLTIDGILRSDNRGNESLFPLFIHDPARKDSEARIQSELRRDVRLRSETTMATG